MFFSIVMFSGIFILPSAESIIFDTGIFVRFRGFVVHNQVRCLLDGLFSVGLSNEPAYFGISLKYLVIT